MRMDRIKLGTRNSPLAMAQANSVKMALEKDQPDVTVEIIPIQSQADWKKADGELPLAEEAGGKGMFATEIERMILDGTVDAGVHSLKDMATDLPDGLAINHVLPRADVRDAFISAKADKIENLPQNAVIGTCSPRRAALALHQRPDFKVVPFRGNVGTRLDKVRSGQVDATFLAMAGLERLGIEDEMIHPMAVNDFLPACGQGVICIETRKKDSATQGILSSINCNDTYLCALAEREVLRILDGSCQTPIAAHAVIEGEALTLKAAVLSLNGQQIFIQEKSNALSEAQAIGIEVGKSLKAQIPTDILTT